MANVTSGIKKKLPALLMAAVILPGLVIGWVALHLVSHQKDARLMEIRSELSNRLAHLAATIENHLNQQVQAIFQRITTNPPDFNDPADITGRVKHLVLNHPVIKYPFFITGQNHSQSHFLFPPSAKSGLAELESPLFAPDQLMKNPKAAEFFRQGYHEEYRKRNFTGALIFYNRSLAAQPGEGAIPYVYNAIGQCYAKLNRHPQAVNYYHKILTHFPNTLRNDPLLNFTVLRQTAQNSMKIPGTQEKDVLKYYLRIYEGALNHEAAGQKDAFAFFKNEAMEFLDRHVGQNKDLTAPTLENAAQRGLFNRLQKTSRLDISMNWHYYDLHSPGINHGPPGQDNMSRFLKLRELYESNDEKTHFYKAVKRGGPWRHRNGATVGPGKTHTQPVRFAGQDYFMVFRVARQNHPRWGRVFFGFMLSADALNRDFLPRVIGDAPMGEDLDVSISRGAAGDRLLTVPFGTMPAGHFLGLTPTRENYLQAQVERDIRLYYLMLAALLLALSAGTVLLYKYLAREKELVRLKSEFVDGASHTLKTPLTRLSLLAETMKQGWTDNQSQKDTFFDAILAETASMNDMIDNMLNFSRIEAGKQRHQPEKNYLQEIAADVVERYADYAKNLGFRLELECDDRVPALMLDPAGVRLILGNLLQNAIKYSQGRDNEKDNEKDSEKYIRVRIAPGECPHDSPHDSYNQWVTLEVEDRGMGIPPGDIPGLFGKFARGKSRRVKAVEGSGLGLFLVRHAVEAHGGRIRVKSEVGQGTRVTVYFPVSGPGLHTDSDTDIDPDMIDMMSGEDDQCKK